MSYNSEQEDVYIRGSCARNGKEGASSRAQVYWPTRGYAQSSFVDGEKQTNNRAEIKAACDAVRQAEQGGDVTVWSKSKYVPDAMNEYMDKWESNGWKTSSGKPVKNQEEFRELRNLVKESGVNIKFDRYGKGSDNQN
eukprot:TRINITY_DN558_c0_g1_i2.p1 TRINITY_DN558_c0_g1~~TRINITY_DN558_c0_g1_i2.p1  ORF type:complete len:138 (-),score=49.66 TRINITY_DN558_c0_g1_i2:175-588(-)